MPVTPTYPGVYIEEVPSGVRTITGVATSIVAFVGRTRRGPTNEPVMVNSFGDFERFFGGMNAGYPMSYAVRDFFLNGGSQALIVRLAHPNFATPGGRDEASIAFSAAKTVADAATGAADVAAAKEAAQRVNAPIQSDENRSREEKAAAKKVFDAVQAVAETATLDEVKKAAEENLPENPADFSGNAVLKLPTETTGQNPAAGQDLVLEASSEGEWGNGLRARVDREGLTAIGDRYAPLTEADLFNLTIRDTNTGATERFLILAVKDSPRRIDRVLENESGLIRVQGIPPGTLPVDTDAAMDKSIDGDANIQDKDEAKEKAKKVQPFSKQDVERPAGQGRSVGVVAADKAKDGGGLDENDITERAGLEDSKRGLYALEKADLFNLLCIPPDTRDGNTEEIVYQKAMRYCVDQRAMLIVDPPVEWGENPLFVSRARDELDELGLAGDDARNAALYFPRVLQADPLRQGQIDTFVPCGIVAGVMARTDAQRGVWKSPAGLDASLNGVQGLQANLTDQENGALNPLGINCLRSFPVTGRVSWGARTLRGADLLASEWKYVPVRRLALYIEESLYRGTQWVVFEPNDEPLWAQIRLNIGAFMQNLFRQGAFQGKTPQEAYFVKSDAETTTQNDINLGIVNIVVGFAPLKPAEFVIVKIQQMPGQIEV